jgi:hypothetical protein
VAFVLRIAQGAEDLPQPERAKADPEPNRQHPPQRPAREELEHPRPAEGLVARPNRRQSRKSPNQQVRQSLRRKPDAGGHFDVRPGLADRLLYLLFGLFHLLLGFVEKIGF